MKKEYDFSNAERGKFYRKGATLRLPIYLDAKVQKFFEKIASRKGTNVEKVVNQVIKKEVELLQQIAKF